MFVQKMREILRDLGLEDEDSPLPSLETHIDLEA
jgi:hypothetical protein